MTSDHGRFCWYDLMTSDPEAAVDFYGAVVGWGTEVWQGEKPYTMWTVDERPIGGLMQLPPELTDQGVPPHWISYVAVDDVDQATAQAGELGGSTAHPATDIPEVGRFSVITDPQGAAIALFTPAGDPPGRAGEPHPGEFSWHELATTDWEAALSFYQQLFGWEKLETADMGEMGIYQMYGRSGVPLGGMFNKPPEMPMPAWLYYAMVSDVDEVVSTVSANDGKILNGPMEVPGGDRIVHCLDPQGAVFALHSKPAAGSQ